MSTDHHRIAGRMIWIGDDDVRPPPPVRLWAAAMSRGSKQ